MAGCITVVVGRISVIVVSYNTRELLEKCLATLGEADEVIVVDNASSDGSPVMVRDRFPAVTLIENRANKGFGAANNQGLDAMSGEYALLLNSDAEARPGAITQLRETLSESPDIVACGGLLESDDGEAQNSCAGKLTLWALICEQTLLEKALPTSRIFSPYWKTATILATNPSGAVDVEQVMGACLAMRPLERFDERFFLYCEDTELCRRLRKHGRIVYVPRARFGHALGASSKSRWKAVARYNRGKELYFSITSGRLVAVLAFTINRLGALLRLLIWLAPAVITLGLVAKFRSQTGLFCRVLLAPLTGPARPPDTEQ